MIMIAAIVMTRSGLLLNRDGPGCNPQITIDPIITAMTASPGMPSAMVVVSEPPRVALDDVSAAVRPSSEPLPNFSGSFDICLARSQPIRPAMSPPAAGTMPTKVPITDPRANGLRICPSSRRVGHQRPSDETGRTMCGRCVRSWSNSSAMPKRPMITAMNGRPELRSLTPKMNLWSPVTGSRPTVAIARPTIPAMMPLSTDRDEIEIMTVRPKTTSANISAGPNLSANCAMGRAATRNTAIDTRIPPVVTYDDATSASPALPCLASG
jgi:hypothetical protein